MRNLLKTFAILLFLYFSENLFSFQFPILTEVCEYLTDSSLVTEYQIENFQDGIEIEINIFKKETKEIIKINRQKIIGDFGKITEKENYKFEIPLHLFPNDFSFTKYITFPKIIFQNRIYYEMKKVKKGKYLVQKNRDEVVSESTQGFYISKCEVSNEQFAAFINSDGYEIEEYWLIKEGTMQNREVGWNFQGKFMMSSPFGWNLSEIPYWKSAASNFIFGPVTNLRWFEANAFCNWMGFALPNLTDISICFSFDSVENDSLYNPVCIENDENENHPLHFVKSNVSEWIILSAESNIPACGPGCREMFYIKNNFQTDYNFPDIGLSCPLYRNEILGFRYILRD